uniref:ATP synthase complex subunit 8 n=1 Tax=Scutiger ningshanensis TaxID=1240007 RepID=A0A1B1UUI3_SCUNI|nr:ATP synthase F0 subunit 8 [Scutiger ningshanensis]
MPQLNPSPWFLILILSWFVFLIVFTPKIHKIHPTVKSNTAMISTPEIYHSFYPWNWIWPWY